MLSRLIKLVSGVQYQVAHVHSRIISSELTGFLFFVGKMGVKWKSFLDGRFPALLTSVVSAAAFVYKARQTVTEPNQIDEKLKKEKLGNATRGILRHLRRDAKKAEAYLCTRELSLDERNLLLLEPLPENPETLLPALYKLFNQIEAQNMNLAKNLWGSTIQAMTNFNELFLLNAYADFELFGSLQLTLPALLPFVVTLYALYDGHQAFQAAQEKSKAPPQGRLWKTITNDFHGYQTDVSQKADERTPLLKTAGMPSV